MSRSRIVSAGEALRSMDAAARIDALARVLALWTAPESVWRAELTSRLAETSGFHRATIAEGLDAALGRWSPERFAACCREELSAGASGGRRLVPYSWTAVLAGGAIPMPTLLSGLLPLVAGSPVRLRATARDPVTPELLGRSLAEVDGRLAEAFESVSFPVDDEANMAALLEAPCVVATGSDDTIQSVRARLAPAQRFVAYGHRFSIAVLGPDAGHDPDARQSLAEGLALDVARWDQSGCLSPVVAYLVGIDAERANAIARAVASALEALGERLPRSEGAAARLALQGSERKEATMRAASGSDVLVLEGGHGTVILEADARPRSAPLHRFLRLHPIPNEAALLDALQPFRGLLSSVALAGFAPAARRRVETDLAGLGVSRSTEAGSLQTPPVDWPHDGMPLVLPLTRFAASEIASTE